MFRQVVVSQWVDGVSDEAKQGFRNAVERLREIPELLAMTYGDDAGHFDDNFDFVVVADFADFESAVATSPTPSIRRTCGITRPRSSDNASSCSTTGTVRTDSSPSSLRLSPSGGRATP